MLRRDQARPAIDEDRILIERLSGEITDNGFGREKVRVTLIMESGPKGRLLPLAARWESFGWRVMGVPEIDEEKAIAAHIAEQDRLQASGLAKLTPEERDALGL